ncbi:MAG: PAS domain S-box protein [Sneathiella sp.]|nr:PAS domain S-box protein [Sneathiella sp.]
MDNSIAYRALPIGLCSFDLDLRYVSINAWLAEINGISIEGHIGCTIEEVLPHVAKHVSPLLRSVIDTGVPILGGEVTTSTAALPEDSRTFRHSYVSITSDSGVILGVSCVVEDITKSKELEEALLRRKDLRFERILATANDSIISIDHAHSITLFNKSAEDAFGYKAEEAMGMPISNLIPERFVNNHTMHIRNFAGSAVSARRMSERTGIYALRKDGTEFPAEASISKITIDGETSFTVILRDISDRREVENEIKATLKQKEVLIDEIHHRVKNNLQVISSILSIQAYKETDRHTFDILKDIQRRIGVMAHIHDTLHQRNNMATINAEDFLRSIIADTKSFSKNVFDNISFTFNSDDIFFDIDHALPCGQIISELISNAIKHAFPNNQSGNIDISLLRGEGGKIELTVADNGVGLPENFDFHNTKSVGIQLIKALVMQLNGEIEMLGADGTRVQISYPEDLI